MLQAHAAVDWKSLTGAFNKPRRLHVEKDEHGLDRCPVPVCDHPGFASRRGCRKHVNVKHPWYKYFDEKPQIVASQVKEKTEVKSTRNKLTLPCCSVENEFSRSFSLWLQSTAGGGKAEKQADISVTRALKFIKFCCLQSGEDESSVLSTVEVIDYFLGSSKLLTRFLDHLQLSLKMGQSGQLGYVSSFSELLDFRKFNSPPGSVLQNFSVTEVYIKRAKKCLAKQMRSHWTTDLDIETLESRRSWASLSELQTVIPFHIGRYKEILEECKKRSTLVSSTNLTFATRFLAVFMFVKIKGCRPMTYIHLTVNMFECAKMNGGMVDQTRFKTAKKYGFNSLYFDKISLGIVDDYVRYVRPLLQPKSEYLLVNRNGAQFQKLTELLSILVFQAIGKYIHPTRYRQIIETESAVALDVEEQKMVSEDQKHSSNVAKVHYQKLRSREVAIRGRTCMEKLRGVEGEVMDTCVEQLKAELIDITDSDRSDCTDSEKELELVNREVMCLQEPTPRKRKEPVRFTKQEDDFIRCGLEKFGPRWSFILRHPDYDFHSGREARTLRMRAIAIKLL